eukprot:7382186-Prymnesium_polylepis.1
MSVLGGPSKARSRKQATMSPFFRRISAQHVLPTSTAWSCTSPSFSSSCRERRAHASSVSVATLLGSARLSEG